MSVKIVKNLSQWFQANSRDLPWRKNPDPYSVWLSEIMLQQTQVTTVLPYFARFKKAFPKIENLAHAPLDEVLKLWAGLGYYSRARNLHQGAQAIAERLENGSGFPKNRAEWLAIPGVGEYTAGAVTSISLNQREAIVDGNVVRVLSRIYAIPKLDAKKTVIWDKARELVNVKNAEPRILNQALMELGALVCKPRNPNCDSCPVSKDCQGKGRPDLYPEPKAKTKWKHLKEEKWVFLKGEKSDFEVYLEKNLDTRWRQGLWDFPDAGSVPISKAALQSELLVKYTVTNHKIERKHSVFVLSPRSREKGRGQWFKFSDLPALPSPVSKALRKVQDR